MVIIYISFLVIIILINLFVNCVLDEQLCNYLVWEKEVILWYMCILYYIILHYISFIHYITFEKAPLLQVSSEVINMNSSSPTALLETLFTQLNNTRPVIAEWLLIVHPTNSHPPSLPTPIMTAAMEAITR